MNGTATLKRSGTLTLRSDPNSMPFIMPIPFLPFSVAAFLIA